MATDFVRMNTNSRSFLCLIFKNKFKGLFKKVFGKKSVPKGGDNNSAERIVEAQKAKVRLTLMGHQCPILVCKVISAHKKKLFHKRNCNKLEENPGQFFTAPSILSSGNKSSWKASRI